MDENMLNAAEEEEEAGFITLEDDEGNEIEFEVLDVVEGHKGHDYVVLLPAADEEATDVVILEIIDGVEPGTEEYISVEDDDIVQEVFDIFKERFEDVFDFAD